MRELARTLLETMVNEVMDAQADMLREDGANARNGYRERGLATPVGDITPRMPKLRAGTYFPEGIIERYSRADRAVAAAVAESWANGVSTRKMERIARKMGINRLSKGQVSALTYLDFPAEHRGRIRTNNVQGRMNREIERRSRVVQGFPSAESTPRPVGAVCAEQGEDWSSRRCISPESTARLLEPTAPEPAGSEASRRRGLMAVEAAMELADGGRRAARGHDAGGFGWRPVPGRRATPTFPTLPQHATASRFVAAFLAAFPGIQDPPASARPSY